MAGKLRVGTIAFAVAVAVVVGVGVGLTVGFAARSLGWPTSFVGSLTGAIVSTLTVVIYQFATGKRDRGGA